MARLTDSPPFTDGNDVRFNPTPYIFAFPSISGWQITESASIDTLEGNDLILTRGFVEVQGELFMSGGDDAVLAEFSVIVDGLVSMGEGNNLIAASQEIINNGSIVLEGKNNAIASQSISNQEVILSTSSQIFALAAISFTNHGSISLGNGINILVAYSYYSKDGLLSTGNGKDFLITASLEVEGESSIIFGSNSDKLITTSSIAIRAYSQIDFSDGDDIIIGGVVNGSNIENNGLLLMGSGNDTVWSLNGGFSGSGSTNLGSDNDTLIGFGTGTFDGGDGVDVLLLNDGVYSIDIASGTIQSEGVTMGIANFELVGGYSEGLLTFETGMLSVVGGVATYISS